ITALLVSIGSFAQISHGGSPISFNKNLGTAPVYTTPTINVQPFIEEDKVTDLHKDIAWRFGIELAVQLNLNNSGLWTTLNNGDRVWRLEIKSPNAKSINLNYSNFNLPPGATFFVYNKNQVLGSFTHANNKSHSEFSTSLLKGDNITLEYYEPFSLQGQGIIEVSSIVHGYRDLFNHLKGFNDAGACNINAICDTTDWGNEIRSSVMYLTAGNSRICSGALVNNTSQDGTPYVLTANHCPMNNNNIFMFNYQSPTCATNTDGPTTQTISGCIPRATNSPSDFRLVELSSVPPANYNVFYAGWSNINAPSTSSTGIHYPRLDVKKISHDTEPVVESGYYSAGNDHWEVIDWNSGTTEGGSSGSPLFDQNHRIIGQLHGGNAACGNDAQDYYGKFSYSWDTNPANNRQLKFWLDPTNTGDTILDGFDPNGPNLTNDVALLDVAGIESFICGDSILPVISIRNNGSANLTSLTINYELDGGGVNTINWTGNLPSYGIDIITLPNTYIANGAHTFTVDLLNPNNITDENILNNNTSINFNSNEFPKFASLTLNTDNYGSETSWLIRDNNTGVTVASSPGYGDLTGGETFNENLCLYTSCFTFVLRDAFGDGYCCAFGSGSMYLLEDATGDTLVVENTNSFTGTNGDSLTFTFCMDTATGINEIVNTNFNIFPNPTTGVFTIKRNSQENAKIIIFDLLGKVVYTKENESKRQIDLDLSSVNKGVYFVSVTTNNERVIQRMVVN
ncbi:MAG: T9SS type A sorting domain-containing protein, partial [Vicingaceae bacterium]|nr:T9SS type A sorting domain-containing protein [Vicingaceae bacterium]